jgi:cephalosporin hydroxylase
MEFINEYHKLYESARIWETNTWLGVKCWKLPMDAFIIQELIFNLKPDFLIETGTGKGGSAFFYASVMELMGHGQVVTCDLNKQTEFDDHYIDKVLDRIHFIHGGSTNPITVKKVKDIVGDTTDNIVLLDSDHRCSHVLQEMGIYEAFVGEGYYLIVEDTHAGNPGHPVKWKYDNEGAYEAVEFFLRENDDFEVDYNCERHLMTFNPSGYLRRIK